jgi:hypothetical protein
LREIYSGRSDFEEMIGENFRKKVIKHKYHHSLELSSSGTVYSINYTNGTNKFF